MYNKILHYNTTVCLFFLHLKLFFACYFFVFFSHYTTNPPSLFFLLAPLKHYKKQQKLHINFEIRQGTHPPLKRTTKKVEHKKPMKDFERTDGDLIQNICDK